MAHRNGTRPRWRVFGGIVLVALLVGAVLLWIFLSVGTPEEAASPQSTSSTEPQPGPMPTSAEGIEDDEPHTPVEEPGACSSSMSAKEYALFLDRVYQFETVYQMQPSDERLALMYPFVTDSFLETQKGDFPDTIVENVSVEVDKGSAVGCSMNSKEELIASITPTVTVVEHHEDGSQTILHGPMTMPSQHFTQWVLIDKIWYVKLDQK